MQTLIILLLQGQFDLDLQLAYAFLQESLAYKILGHLLYMLKTTGYIFKGGNSVITILLPSEKESTLKGKNLLPRGANSFLLV